MSKKGDKRRDILRRVNRRIRVRHLMKQCREELGASSREVADVLLKIEKTFTPALGGKANFTGDVKRTRCGGLLFQVRCKKCNGLYWVGELPYALCVDCDPVYLFR